MVAAWKRKLHGASDTSVIRAGKNNIAIMAAMAEAHSGRNRP
jgi:hypothetical protein